MQIDDPITERASLGAILRARGAKEHLVDMLAPADYADPYCRRACQAMLRARAAKRPLDYPSVAAELRAMGAPDDDLLRLPDLAEHVVSLSAEHHVDRVREMGALRRLLEADMRRIVGDAETAADAFAEVRGLLDTLDGALPRSGVIDAATLAQITSARIEAASHAPSGLRGRPTGFAELDRILSGLRDGCLYVVGARPGAGKTAFGMNVATEMTFRREVNALVFEMEMSAAQLGERIVASEGRIQTTRVASGRMEPAQWERVSRTISHLSGSGLFVDERSGLSIEEMIATARRLHGQHRLALVVIDYLQLARSSRRHDNREQEVSTISRGAKHLARVLNCPVLALCQVNRKLEERADKRPTLADLRESGSIEQDADAVIFLYRPALYDKSADPEAAEIIVAKHRHGPVGTQEARWIAECTRFEAAS